MEEIKKKKIQRNERQFKSMLDSMQEGFLVINEKGILQEVNTELCNILRRPSSDLVGKAIVHFMAKESKMAFLQRVDDWKDKYSFIFQANFIRPNGSTVICMIKGTPLREEDGKVTGGFAMISDITDQITTYMDLQESEKKWRLLYDNMPGGSFVVNEDHEIEDVNEVVLKITGFSKDELLGNDCSLICGHDLSSCPIFTDNSKNINNIETFIGTKSKKLIPIIKSTRKITLENRVLIIENFQDLTKLKEVEQNLQEKEAQLLHSQKMEAVGVLVGGVAHDFNNLLTVINGYSDMILEEASSTDPFREEMEEIRNAGKRAKSLTAQLLAFSRKQVLKLQTIDLNSVILNVQKMLFRLIGEDIQLKTTLTKAFWFISADLTQLEQIILNLSVNARDAMPFGGELWLETDNIKIETQKDGNDNLAPGKYVLMKITDTGTGMSAEILEQIYNPFFTTKEEGKGTGLGLSTVYEIVQQLHGFIKVKSKVGKGTTFYIYIPIMDKSEVTEQTTHDYSKNLTGSERILVVEDNLRVRKFIQKLLVYNGYAVEIAKDGKEALVMFSDSFDSFDLIITDVIMPKMNGTDLHRHIKAISPDSKILFISGYIENSIIKNEIVEKGLDFIQKPFDLKVFLRKIRDIIETKFLKVARKKPGQLAR